VVNTVCNYTQDTDCATVGDIILMQQLQLLLTDYLDIQNMAGDPQQAPTSFSESTSDISVYFARRRPPRQKRVPLFKFDYSSHALTMNSYLKEQRASSAKVDCNS
jgi:hypothetical protein